MKTMRTLTSSLAVAMVAAAAMVVGLSAQGKSGGGNAASVSRWACSITFAPVQDGINADSAGAYVDGTNGIVCGVNLTSGTSTYQWLNVDLTARTNNRGLVYTPQPDSGSSGAGWNSFSTKGTFQVVGFSTVTSTDTASPDSRPFRAFAYDLPAADFASGSARFSGNFVNGDGTPNPANVTVLSKNAAGGSCSWLVTFDAEMRVDENTKKVPWGLLRGYYPMSYRAIVTLLPGVNGCK